jgi:hypothetical protein
MNKNKLSSSIWNYFQSSTKDNSKSAICNYCKKSFKCGNSTGTLWNHLKSVHTDHHDEIDFPLTKTEKSAADAQLNTNKQKKNLQTMDDFVHKLPKVDLKFRYSRAVCKSAFSMKAVAESEDFSDGMKALNYSNVPTSPSTVKSYIMDFGNQIRNLYKEMISKLIKQGK